MWSPNGYHKYGLKMKMKIYGVNHFVVQCSKCNKIYTTRNGRKQRRRKKGNWRRTIVNAKCHIFHIFHFALPSLTFTLLCFTLACCWECLWFNNSFVAAHDCNVFLWKLENAQTVGRKVSEKVLRRTNMSEHKAHFGVIKCSTTYYIHLYKEHRVIAVGRYHCHWWLLAAVVIIIAQMATQLVVHIFQRNWILLAILLQRCQ